MSSQERDRLKVLQEVRKRHITQRQAVAELRLSPGWVRQTFWLARGTESLKRCPNTNLTRHGLLRLPRAKSWRLARLRKNSLQLPQGLKPQSKRGPLSQGRNAAPPEAGAFLQPMAADG
jgi:hypothetical protein